MLASDRARSGLSQTPKSSVSLTAQQQAPRQLMHRIDTQAANKARDNALSGENQQGMRALADSFARPTQDHRV